VTVPPHRTLAKQFTLVPFHEITLSAEPRYLVGGLIPRGGLALLYGPSKSGKSFLAFNIAMHVALAKDWRGCRVIGGPVVYLQLEGQAGFAARAEAFRQRHLPEDPGQIDFYLQQASTDLVSDWPALVAAIEETLGTKRPVLVVIDTLNRSLRGSEASDLDMTAYITATDAIRTACACAVLIVHHTGLDITRPRGHTALTAAVDVQIAVRKTGDFISATVELAKDGPEGKVIYSRLETLKEVGHDVEGQPISSCVLLPADVVPSVGRSKPLSAAGKIVMRAFGRLIEAGRTQCIPNVPGARDGDAVRLDDLKAMAFEVGLFPDPEPTEPSQRRTWRNSRNTAFRRGVESCQAAGRLRVELELAWEPHAQVSAGDER
jgi:hypothetical protein